MSAARARAAWTGVLAFVLVHAPRAASACAVCTSGRDDETRLAFLLTTLFLSAMPMILVGGLAWWLVRRARATREQHEASAAAPDVSRASSSL